MKTQAVRLYGKKDLRLETFELPPVKDDEILARIVSDSICMSSYKAAILGADHKRVPEDLAEHPIIIGHEFCGEIVDVGKRWQRQFHAGQKFSIQPNLKYQGRLGAPGYSYQHIGGSATYIIIPHEVMEMNCLLDYQGEAFFPGSLAEPMSCIVAGLKATYHIEENYIHHMGPVKGGNMAILAGVGPMGLGAIDYAIHSEQAPGLLVVTDIAQGRLDRASSVYPVEEARKFGVELQYVNTRELEDPEEFLLSLTGGKGYDDVFVFAPVQQLVGQADKILGCDGCLNFFAGPTDQNFSAAINFYDVHYLSHHISGTSGGNTADMLESLRMMAEGRLNPATMVTHIGGLDSVAETTLNLPDIPGGKKLIYTNISLPLTAIEDFERKGRSEPMYAELAHILGDTKGVWSAEAERYLLEHAAPI